MEWLLVIMLFICIGQIFYIYRLRQITKQWYGALRGFRQGRQEKIFTTSKGLLADISYELNGIMEANRNQIAQLKKSDEASRQILTGLSHDVRTPLASLLGYLEALNQGMHDDKEQREYISVAYRKAADLKALVDKLFEWFKLNSNEQQFSMEETDINEYTREILIDWLPVLEQSHISLAVNIEDDDLVLSLDQMAYRRIMDNLLQNAVRHSGCTQITIAVRPLPGSVLLEVANNGRAIPAQQLPFIFERLYKGNAARSDKGSGLGLAITKELVTALKGEISVSSNPGNDTVFSIRLPRQVKEAASKIQK
ncbi:sensor histidine kinase [Paenibacillus senegalensis]|uniref:sensor histidine kinase n=1 Tax=Paenibacillus senegalensis TaxID=1465766 RepID=UPI0002885F93|nr:HAMP domain-containing sensor histidine kinase [Paenibacillus senegalensis]